MANQVAARLRGDDYQHLFGWYDALELLMPKRRVRLVTVEDALAGSVDDVTIQHEVGASLPDKFYQYKYHVDQRGEYSSAVLIAHRADESSLLEKFWRTWQLLRERDPQRVIELHLVSNWTWDAKDKFKSCIDGSDNSIRELFFEASPGSALGKIRQAWQAALKANDAEFREFIGCLRLRLGFDCSDELEKRVAERMEFLGLKSDNMALLGAVGIVRGWVKSGKQELSKSDLERTLRDHHLILPDENEQGVTLYLTTIKAQKFDIAPDYVLDWRSYFAGDQNVKAHELVDPADWNGLLLPEIRRLEAKINEDTDSRLVRARGVARLSAWFALGFTFSDVARYTIEVDQNGRLWRTDAPRSDDFRVLIDNNGPIDGEIIHNDGKTVAVGVSVTGQLNEDVRRYLSGRTERVAALLLLRPERELGRECLRSDRDVVALADGVKTLTRDFVKKWGAEKLLLFYFGPLSGACFIGHRLNAVCREIQVMEDQQPGYSPSFLLS